MMTRRIIVAQQLVARMAHSRQQPMLDLTYGHHWHAVSCKAYSQIVRGGGSILRFHAGCVLETETKSASLHAAFLGCKLALQTPSDGWIQSYHVTKR